jgi:excisionase family DNA binding protein
MKSKPSFYSHWKIWRLYVDRFRKAAISKGRNGSSGVGVPEKLKVTERLTVFMNRWLKRKEIVEVNKLTKKEEKQVFERLETAGGVAGRYLEEDVDRIIGRVRRVNRPRGDSRRFVSKEEFLMESETLERPAEESLAGTLRSIFDWFKPRLESLLPDQEQRISTSGPRLLTPIEAATIMRVNPQTVMKWCRQQKMGIKAGRRWLISQDEVDRYLRGVLFKKGPKEVAP